MRRHPSAPSKLSTRPRADSDTQYTDADGYNAAINNSTRSRSLALFPARIAAFNLTAGGMSHNLTGNVRPIHEHAPFV